MKKTALMFPGQGSQYQGMGIKFLEDNPKYMAYIKQCNQAMGIDILEIIAEQPHTLSQTEYSQPAIYSLSCAYYDYLKENTSLAIQADAAIGHSLGDYSALYASGGCSFYEGLNLVIYRSKIMAEQNHLNPGMMAAVLGQEYTMVEELIKELKINIYIANYNSHNQIVLSGLKQDMVKAIEQLKHNGVRKILPLKVGASSHCPLMEPVARKLKSYLNNNLTIGDLNIPFFSSSGKKWIVAEEVKEILEKQLITPINWLDSVIKLLNEGFNAFVEIGPKNVLASLVLRISQSERNSIEVFDFEDNLDTLLNDFKNKEGTDEA